MIGWLIGGTGIVMAVAVWWSNRGQPRIAPLAIPASPLASRLNPLLMAIQQIQLAARELNPRELFVCAPSRGERAVLVEDDVGPGRRPFLQIHGAIHAIEPDDRRALAQAGFDLARLESALEPVSDPERWRDQLLKTFEQLERALGRAHDPYR